MSQCEENFVPLRQQARAAIESTDPSDNAEAIAALEDYSRNSNAPCEAQRREARILIISLAANLGVKEFTTKLKLGISTRPSRAQSKASSPASKTKPRKKR